MPQCLLLQFTCKVVSVRLCLLKVSRVVNTRSVSLKTLWLIRRGQAPWRFTIMLDWVLWSPWSRWAALKSFRALHRPLRLWMLLPPSRTASGAITMYLTVRSMKHLRWCITFLYRNTLPTQRSMSAGPCWLTRSTGGINWFANHSWRRSPLVRASSHPSIRAKSSLPCCSQNCQMSILAQRNSTVS